MSFLDSGCGLTAEGSAWLSVSIGFQIAPEQKRGDAKEHQDQELAQSERATKGSADFKDHGGW